MNRINNKNTKNKNKQKQNKKKKSTGSGKMVSSGNDRLVEKFATMELANSAASRIVKPSGRASLRLPKCTLKYALALVDPFDVGARGCCIPIGSSETMKTHAYARFDMTLGTNGAGLIYVTPSLANDMPSIFYTNSAWAGASNVPVSASGTIGAGGTASTFATGWELASHNGPFGTGNLIGNELVTFTNTAVAYGKIVAVGLRVQYTGTTLNESGLFYCYHSPDHSSIAGMTTAALGRFGDCNIEGVSRRPCTLNVFGVDAEEDVFSNSGHNNTTGAAGLTSLLYPYSNGDHGWTTTYAGSTSYDFFRAGTAVGTYQLPVGVPVGAIYVTGVSGQTVHCETIFHMEYVGPAAGAMLTPTTPDVEGFQMCKTAALRMPQAKLANPRKDTWSLMYDALTEVAHMSVPYIVPAAKGVLASLL